MPVKKGNVIDDYIDQSPEEHRKKLLQVRKTIKKHAPDSIEKISWGMPTFWQVENLIHFAAMKNHMGLYPGEDAVIAFTKRLTKDGYKFSKGAIQFPWAKPMPYELIAEITQYRVLQITKKKPKKAP
ncbi:MAG: DUF1801 domain-containing protein [Treponema sp.]|jgi:uncharacterized protein YdhG (YjbR/CyaY superfamily)|nr:DUF1801 domain-containing protein [Treponema sp.]